MIEKKQNIGKDLNLAEDEAEEELAVVDKEICEEIKAVNSECIDANLIKFSKIQKTKGQSAAVFKLKEDILGPSKFSNDPVAIVDPETGIEVMTPQEIKKVSLKYCVRLLTNREPSDQYYDYVQRTKALHWERMTKMIKNDLTELLVEMYNDSLSILLKNPGQKYNLITKGYHSLHNIG